MTRHARTLILTAATALLLAAAPPTPASNHSDTVADTTDLQTTKDPWNIETSTPANITQHIDTTEGTWISLDVSPDGTTIVFDLLGDLYTIPITGGTATSITSGLAWDQQPRFSPDGTRIAFCSDRTGTSNTAGDNIWTIHLDTGELTQITDESFRLVNNPNWHPSGNTIVAKKHFTSRRSLGAGEMWLYHASGINGGATSGVQLTEKPTLQKDVNEPVFSPDGKYLYFSEDVWPGSTFQYNKDSNKQIYVVNRLNLEDGTQDRYITGPGGACRPQPSPDGKTIAFVRRIDGKTGLHLFDTASGAITCIYDDLERDMQESWALHGVYSGYDWTPDGNHIVFWSRGKIRKINTQTHDVEVIPFRVKDTRMVAKNLRFPIDPAPDQVNLKLLRWPTVSPSADSVVFQTLGKLYTRELAADGTLGDPQRITDDKTRFEFHPAFSRDGTRLAYTTWHDTELGRVRIIDLNTGNSWDVTGEPGHYADPVFSPDGNAVVYRKLSGGWLTSPVWSEEPGIYRASTDPDAAESNGRGERIVRSGENPQFGASNERLYFETAERTPTEDNRKLVSVTLDGGHEQREHAISDWATRFIVSPDGNHIAFVERFNVHVAPLISAGKAVKLGPNASAVPTTKLSESAGEFIHFSGDGQTLHWSQGPILYSRPLAESFAHLAGTPKADLPEPTNTGIDLSFDVPHDIPDSTVALTNGRIVTMAGPNHDRIINNGSVIIQGNRITAVGPADDITVPDGAVVFDLEGRTALPGFFEAHGHGAMAVNSGITPQQNWVHFSRLGFGVTAIHDPSNNTNAIFSSSEMVKAGKQTGPRTFSTGTILYGAAGSFAAPVDSYDDAMFHLKRLKQKGAFSVKSYNQPRRDQRQQVVEAARELEMQVVPEGGATFMHNLTMIVDGHTGIEHTFPVEIVYDDTLQLWKGTNVGYTPTLSVAYGGLAGEYYWYHHDDVWKNPRVAAFVPPTIVEPRAKRRQKAPEADYNHFLCARICKQAIDIGINVQPGGHGQLQGLNTHWEMWMMVHGGMSPLEALRCGTLNAARHFSMDADLGSIETGKLADIIIMEADADPLANIRDSDNIEWVIANGRVYESKTMNQLVPEFVERQPFFWELDGFDGRIGTPPVGTECTGCGTPGIAHWHEDMHGQLVPHHHNRDHD